MIAAIKHDLGIELNLRDYIKSGRTIEGFTDDLETLCQHGLDGVGSQYPVYMQCTVGMENPVDTRRRYLCDSKQVPVELAPLRVAMEPNGRRWSRTNPPPRAEPRPIRSGMLMSYLASRLPLPFLRPTLIWRALAVLGRGAAFQPRPPRPLRELLSPAAFPPRLRRRKGLPHPAAFPSREGKLRLRSNDHVKEHRILWRRSSVK